MHSQDQSSCKVRGAWGQTEEEEIGAGLRGCLPACGHSIVDANSPAVKCASLTDSNLKEDVSESTKESGILLGKPA